MDSGLIHTGRGARRARKFERFSFDIACVQCGHTCVDWASGASLPLFRNAISHIIHSGQFAHTSNVRKITCEAENGVKNQRNVRVDPGRRVSQCEQCAERLTAAPGAPVAVCPRLPSYLYCHLSRVRF